MTPRTWRFPSSKQRMPEPGWECSDNTKTGDAWYEEGSYPIISTTYGDEPAAFLRGMILPVEYDEYPDTAMWIEGEKKVQSSWKNYSQQVIMLR